MAKKILFLTLNPPKPSTKQRITDSLPYLAERGISYEVTPMPSNLPGRVKALLSVRRFDAVCIQKKLLWPFEIRLMRRLNPNIVYDVDDAVMFHELERSEKMTGKFFSRYMAMMDNCRAVIVGNRFLYEFSRHNNDNVHIVPTPVNVSTYTPKDYSAAGGREVVIGWMGMRGNLKYLDIAAPALTRLASKNPDVRFKILSREFIDIEGVQVIKKRWTEEEYVDDLRGMDIGIMPQTDDIWSLCKCGNKILQYFAVGIPAVASPVGVNSEIIEHGVDGFLASTEEEWFDCLSRLVSDRDLRMRMGLKGRGKVVRLYSQEVHQARLFEILSAV